jgi:hypothetical protein
VDFGAKAKKNSVYSVYSVFIGLYWRGEKRMAGAIGSRQLASARIGSHWLGYGGRSPLLGVARLSGKRFGFFDN